MTRLSRLAVVAIAFFSARCATHSNRVDEGWLARIPEQSMGGIDRARTELRREQDQVLRASVAVRDAQRSLQSARLELEATTARVKAEQIALETARARGQATDIDQALAQVRAAREADATTRWEEFAGVKTLRLAEAESELAVQREALADARLRLSEYEALRTANDVRAQQLSQAGFNQAIGEALVRTSKAQREVELRQAEARDAQTRLEEVRSRAHNLGRRPAPGRTR